MTVALALVVGMLYAVGTWLLLTRTLSRILLGLSMMTHGANLLLLFAGGRAGRPPLVGEGAAGTPYADPLPQALALTAIVITFGTTAFLLALAYRGVVTTGSDEAPDDLEDRRIARLEDRGRGDGEEEGP